MKVPTRVPAKPLPNPKPKTEMVETRKSIRCFFGLHKMAEIDGPIHFRVRYKSHCVRCGSGMRDSHA